MWLLTSMRCNKCLWYEPDLSPENERSVPLLTEECCFAFKALEFALQLCGCSSASVRLSAQLWVWGSLISTSDAWRDRSVFRYWPGIERFTIRDIGLDKNQITSKAGSCWPQLLRVLTCEEPSLPSLCLPGCVLPVYLFVDVIWGTKKTMRWPLTRTPDSSGRSGQQLSRCGTT